jgi:hypothetical protein
MGETRVLRTGDGSALRSRLIGTDLNVPSNLRDNNRMVKSVEGVYRNGRVDLIEPLDEAEGSRVIVTWVGAPQPVDLRERGIDESQAADRRRRLSSVAEDWDRPEMIVYDELPPR